MRHRTASLNVGDSTTILPGGAVPHHPARRTRATSRRYVLASWLALIGLMIPGSEAQVFIAGAKFTPARLALMALIVPAIFTLARRGWHLVACDIAVGLMMAWILTAASVTSSSESLSSTAAVGMEFLFSYIVGRAFFIQSVALDVFVRTLKLMTIFVVMIAMAEVITGRWLAHEMTAMIFGTSPLGAVFRQGIIRATSTLDHPILFGVFCALVNVILLFWERSAGRRFLSSFVCLAGCFFSQSSAALMAYALGVAAYSYEHLMRQIPTRWVIFWSFFGGTVGVAFLISQHPIGWLISHLTLDPQSGYFRILIWDLAFERIGQSPLFGHSFEMFGDPILDTTIDCVWLVNALRFGIPASALLFLANVTAFWPTQRSRMSRHDLFDQRMRLAFTTVLLLFIFSGITVHFWNYMWIFWGLCIGIRGALREKALNLGTMPFAKKLGGGFKIHERRANRWINSMANGPRGRLRQN